MDIIDELLREGQRISTNCERFGPFDAVTRAGTDRLKTIQYRLRCLMAGEKDPGENSG